MQEISPQQLESAKNPRELLEHFLNNLGEIARTYIDSNSNDDKKAEKKVGKKTENKVEDKIVMNVIPTFILTKNPILKKNIVSVDDVDGVFSSLKALLNNKDNKLPQYYGFGESIDTKLAENELRPLLRTAKKKLAVMTFDQRYYANNKDYELTKKEKERLEADNLQLTQTKEKLEADNLQLTLSNNQLTAQVQIAKNREDHLEFLIKNKSIMVSNEVLKQLGFDPESFAQNTPNNNNISATNQSAPNNTPTVKPQTKGKAKSLSEEYRYKSVPKGLSKADRKEWYAKNPLDHYKAAFHTALPERLYKLVFDAGIIYKLSISGQPKNDFVPISATASDKIYITKMSYAVLNLALQPALYESLTWDEQLARIKPQDRQPESAPLIQLIDNIQEAYAPYDAGLPKISVSKRYDAIKDICREGNDYIFENPEWVVEAQKYLEHAKPANDTAPGMG